MILLTAGVFALAGWGTLGRGAALGFLLGATWGAANLLAWDRLVRTSLGADGLHLSRAILPLLVKLPLLYAAGAALVLLGLPAPWLAAGFTWSLAVPVLKTLGSALVGNPSARARRAGQGIPAPEGITG